MKLVSVSATSMLLLLHMLHMLPSVVLSASASARTMSTPGVVPEVTAQNTYPRLSDTDAVLLEWGSSAIIHNADGVVANFGPSAGHPEFQLGIEAELVTASPRQGCEPLSNARLVETQIVVMYRGGCTFGEKARIAIKAGAAAMIVVNSDRRSPDRAFGMSARHKGDANPPAKGAEDEEDDDDEIFSSLPSVMVSYAAGLQLREHSPPRMRIFAGAGRPFIEAVTDSRPILYLVHNAITESEIAAARAKLAPFLSPTASDPSVERAHRVLGLLRGSELSNFYERLSSIVGYPTQYISDLALETRTASGKVTSSFTLRDERRISKFNAELGDDPRFHTVMTVHVYLDSLNETDGGALYFPRAIPLPTRLIPTKGLAAVWYSSLEDGSLDTSAAHGESPLVASSTPGEDDEKSFSYLHLRVYNTPRPLARRLILPLLLSPVSGAPSKTVVFAARRFFSRAVGPDAPAENAVDLVLLLLALAVVAPFGFLGYAAFKAYERSKMPPKRRAASNAGSSAKKGSSASEKKKSAIGKKA